MTPNEYQKLANRTLTEKPGFQIEDPEVMVVWNALGLCGEAGEVADLIKKGVFHQQGIDKDKLKKELGDVLWYLAALCTELGWTMEEVMALNIEKLKARFPEGFDPDRSTFREGMAE